MPAEFDSIIEEMRIQIEICRDYIIMGPDYLQFDRFVNDFSLADDAPDEVRKAYAIFKELSRKLDEMYEAED